MRHSKPRRALCRTALAAALVLAPIATALAADLDVGYPEMPEVLPQQNVAFGSGWYIRGDLGATRGLGAQAGDEPYADMYTGPGLTPPGLSSLPSTRVTFDATIAGGYQFTRYLRADVGFDYLHPTTSSRTGAGQRCVTGNAIDGTSADASGTASHVITYSTTCTPTLTAKLSSYATMVNGYVDLGTYGIVTPYVGAGVGVAFGSASASSSYLQGNNKPYHISYTDALNQQKYSQNWDRSQTVNYYNFAYALMAGFAFDVYAHTKLDIGYRYLNLGNVIGKNVATHQARAGLRYMIAN